MGGRDKCTVCHHPFSDHYHMKSMWVKVQSSSTSVDADMQAKYNAAVSDQERLKVLKNKAEQNLQQTEMRQQKLSDDLLSNILKFEAYSNARNYAGMLRSQIRLLETWIEAKDGLAEAEQMVRDMIGTKSQLEEALKVVSSVRDSKQIPGVPPPHRPHGKSRSPRRRRAGVGATQLSAGKGFFGSKLRCH